MVLFQRLFRFYSLAILLIVPCPISAKMHVSRTWRGAEEHNPVQRVRVVVRTNHEKYSLGDALKLDVSLQNSGSQTVYVDRRMFWGGFGGGLKLEIADSQGRPVPSRMLNDALMPPPSEADTSLLIRLDEGFFYGTKLDLPVRHVFPKPGRYSLRVIYKSWLRRDFVAPQLRGLPAVWADSPEIASNPVWIDIAQ